MFLFFTYRLPVVNDCPAGQTARVTSNLHSSSSSTMAVSRVPSPPLAEVNTPVAENWCYTQVSEQKKKKKEPWPNLMRCASICLKACTQWTIILLNSIIYSVVFIHIITTRSFLLLLRLLLPDFFSHFEFLFFIFYEGWTAWISTYTALGRI